MAQQTFTVRGLDAGGNPITEEIVVEDDETPVETTQKFSRVLSVTPSIAGGTTVQVGWLDAVDDKNGLTLDAAAASISPPREITLTSAQDLSGVTFTLVGLDRWGNPIEETLIGPDSDTVKSRKIFSSLTAVIPSAPVEGGSVEVGFPERVCSPWLVCGPRYNTDTVPTAVLQAEQIPGEDFGSCIVEVTNENVLRISGEGAFATDASQDLDADGKIVQVQAPFVRVVLEGSSGSARVHVARPGV